MNDLKSHMAGTVREWYLKGYDIATGEITFILKH